MYQLTTDGRGRTRLVAATTLTPDDFAAIARDLGVVPARARKVGPVAATPAAGGERIETHWNGKESVATAAAGDLIVTSLDAAFAPLRDRDGNINVYVIRKDRFGELYEPAAGPAGAARAGLYRPRGVVEAIALDGGFEILAPWGETQRADAGYLLLNGREVYGNHADTYRATYEPIG